VDGRTSSTVRRNETILRPSGVWWVTVLFESPPILHQPFQQQSIFWLLHRTIWQIG
jgi:hypothetical protein